MAGLRAGYISNGSCSSCPKDEALKRLRGCDGNPAPRPVKKFTIDDREFILWNCPTLFITQWCRKFINLYDLYEMASFKGDPLTIPLKYIRAVNFYEENYNQFSQLVRMSNS